MSPEEYRAALDGAEPVTYHRDHCRAVLSLGEVPCDPDRCGALFEHMRKREKTMDTRNYYPPEGRREGHRLRESHNFYFLMYDNFSTISLRYERLSGFWVALYVKFGIPRVHDEALSTVIQRAEMEGSWV